jgi:hypothetical protein
MCVYFKSQMNVSWSMQDSVAERWHCTSPYLQPVQSRVVCYRGVESLTDFKICFNLDDAVMLETAASVLVGLTNGRHSSWPRLLWLNP